MKGAWIALATSLSMAGLTAGARAEPPERGGEEPSAAAERNDPPDPPSSAGDSSWSGDTSSSSGGEVEHNDPGPAPGSSGDSSSVPDRGTERHHSREAPPASGESSSSSGHERGRHHSAEARSAESDEAARASGELSSQGRESAAPPPTDAQRRHPRPGTGTGDRIGRGSNGYGSGSHDYDSHDPLLYGSYGYSPFEIGGFYGYAPDYYRNRYRAGGSLRIFCDPGRTRVYVEGYYAGIADDFDGIFQRLYLPPGQHEITLALEGYRTHRVLVYMPLDQTIRIHHVMDRGTGETDEVVGEPQD
jgi:hypothetical protein